MGACFGCCLRKTIGKQSHRSNFLLTESSNEIPQDEEFFELEQRAERKPETQSPKSTTTCEVVRPNKLTFKKPHFTWRRVDTHASAGTILHHGNMKSPADSIMPLLHRESSFAETCSFAGSQKWEQISAGVTPGSSVDLEWENEIGFNSSANFGATEELQWMVLTENTNNSWRSSPVSNSNGLEWDGDFTSVDISEIITETQRLTTDLEDNAEKDTSNISFRDAENNN
ncbi:uncharacterized protein LOC129225941 [Uloborus diversus]|uniref:uncharacterized protein LOC129225941 n=1 Tax=Uloborus diversus TaxID=327109 RepID=UPI002409EAC6|nr:uncharacterized protein LOC129225941 [Uloborus diversus]